ncbi:DapH/DapD/GlmU-related protein [Aeromonas veronii]|uniref:DapH/DapD/GlmU-related protein n=1 Tax=Aeromonas veronii TaxID=654 RepID=UPI002443EA49|nr:DapH/DapD/GlmU-related protein [Aeromonas veronii]
MALTFIALLRGGVNIGENVIIGPKCNIWTYNHNFKYPEMIPYGGDDILKPVVIHDHVWIGLNVTILPGTTIGKGAIISAGSVVRGEIKALSIMAGNPAEVVGYRNEADFHVNEMKNNFYLRKKVNIYSTILKVVTSNFISAFLSFSVSIILVRAFSPENAGEIITFYSYLLVFAAISEFGAGNAYIAIASKNENKVRLLVYFLCLIAIIAIISLFLMKYVFVYNHSLAVFIGGFFYATIRLLLSFFPVIK